MKLNKGTHTRDSDSFKRKTLQEYKNDYLDILDYYKSKNIDNDEESFIDYEIGLIKEFIKPVVENIRTEIEIKGIIDLEIELNVKPFISSYNKIISFLETKKADFYKEQILPIQQTEIQSMRDKLFKIGKNFLALSKEYSFSENESFFIKGNFWPIIVVNSYDAEWVKNQLIYHKIEFIEKNKKFDLDIFKRYYLDILMNEINEFLDSIKKGKTKIWDERNGDYFHWFKLQSDYDKHYTLLISDKNEIQLEIYFKTLLSEISKFIENEQALSIQQIETKSEIEQAGLFENNFDKVKPIEIYNHFKAGLVDKGYLTEQELNGYLKAAFELQTIPETLFKIKDASTKQKITNVFYQYFRNIAGTPHGKQKQYAALLGDYFEGYVTKNVSTNFNK